MAKKIRVIWYKAAWDKHWLDNAISIWTGLISAKNRKVGPYSHVEIWTADEQGRFIKPMGEMISTSTSEGGSTCTLYAPKDMASGTCWTSTMRGKDNGTVKRRANTVINNAARWDFAEFEISDEKYNDFIAWAEEKVRNNKGYSKRDLLKFFGLGIFSDDLRDICSEFSNDGLVIMFILATFGVVSPRRLAYLITQAGGVIKPLTGQPTQEDINNIIKDVNGKE